MPSTLNLFLPDSGLAQSQSLFQSLLQSDYRQTHSARKDTDSFEADFLSALDIASKTLPWGRLRAAQFELSQKFQFICCADPIMLHTTHRGAYMVGAADRLITHEQALRIVAELNQTLTEAGESYWLLDNGRWLFSSEAELDLQSLPLAQLIGKDLFNYQYQGEQAASWTARANEAQMLIHQMADYQQLMDIPPQYTIGLHFWSPFKPQQDAPLPFTRNGEVTLMSNESLLEVFALQTLTQYLPIAQWQQCNTVKPGPYVIYWRGDDLQALSKELSTMLQSADFDAVQIRYGDALQEWQRKGFWAKWFSRNISRRK